MDDELKLWYLLSDSVDELREGVLLTGSNSQVTEFMALTARQLRLIQEVCRLTRYNPEGISLKTLAEKMQLSSSAVSLMVETLVQKDELERVHSSADRRMVLIRVSPRGRTAIDKIRNRFRDIIRDFLNDRDPAEREQLEDLLTCLLEKIRSLGAQ